MNDQPVVVLITAPSLEAGKEIARKLVERRLAACVNLLNPIQSIYTWEGKIQEEEEILLIVKTRAEIFENELIPAVRESHPYEVPEIISIPILSGLESYLTWIADSTS